MFVYRFFQLKLAIVLHKRVRNFHLKLDIFVPDSGQGKTKISIKVKHCSSFSRNIAKLLPFPFIHL